MARTSRSKGISRAKLILYTIWLVSFSVMTSCTVIIMSYSGPIPLKGKVLLYLPLQIACGFFFPISIGKMIQWLRDVDIATVLWDFISDCGEAGLTRFYATRDTSDAKSDLGRKFDEHAEGDILLTGPSLRLFFAPDTHFRKVIERNIDQYGKRGVKIRIVNADADKNVSVPIRSFIEEFDPDGELPRGKLRREFEWQSDGFNWDSGATSADPPFSLEEFYSVFRKEHSAECRVILDLKNVEIGVDELNGKAGIIHARKSICAPYFTAVIFPDICYYTPNMLCPRQPVNMPMLAFRRGGPVYDRILTHFKFLWWSGDAY